MFEQKDLENLISYQEQVGVIGSPSTTTNLTIDILESSATTKLLGEMLIFIFEQDNLKHYALGQVSEVVLKNRWLETTTIRSLARQTGFVYPISATQDVHVANMNVGAVFAESNGTYTPSILGTVPPTGTPLYKINDEILNGILSRYLSELFYLGRIYGSNSKLPMWFKHFGVGREGAGEAYHIGIFGKTGSGKSVLAKMMVVAYAKHKEMSIIIIDPQGEFSADLSGKPAPGGFRINLSEVLTKDFKKQVKVYSVKDLVLDRWELFEEILYESDFFEKLSIPQNENRRIACSVLSEKLQKKKVKLTDLHTFETFQKVWDILSDKSNQTVIYRSEESRNRLDRMLKEAVLDEFYKYYWLPFAQLFNENKYGAMKIDSILKNAFYNDTKPIISINLSTETSDSIFWNEKIQTIVIKRLLEGIRFNAERAYREGKTLNTLVVLDESHRFAPREKPDSEFKERLRSILLDAVRTTRKYGLGWMFISQTLSSLHREIINQLRIMFFGYGLSMGAELQALKEIVGGDPKLLGLYQSFKDPHSSFDAGLREYPFMSVGPVSPLSFSGSPLYFIAFNTPEEFLSANGHYNQQFLFE